ncbi:hypothetical protein APHAL10511_004864 [Amanita phalloides]|nr:hypothetical protein APHAL10511_004864 [Amanita phalloides]
MVIQLPRIRLVTFDALHTIITPRHPINVQYSVAFEPYLGILKPEAINRSFKTALRALQAERPVYARGSEKWWAEIIERTALGAGADSHRLQKSLPIIVPQLLKRFSSSEGYKAFEDAIPTVRYLHDKLNIRTAVVSNADTRIRSVLQDLNFPPSIETIVLSEEEGVEKPMRQIFSRTIELVNRNVPYGEKLLSPAECLHIGDELICDYEGARNAGLHALLLRRRGLDGEQAHKEVNESLEGVHVVEGLNEVIELVENRN